MSKKNNVVKKVVGLPEFYDEFLDEGISWWQVWVVYLDPSGFLSMDKLIFDTKEEAELVKEGYEFELKNEESV